MTNTKSLSYGIVIALVLAIVYMFGASATQVFASAPSGLPSTVATTSVASVSATASLVLATSTCAARVISTTGAGGIMLGFSDNQGFVPSSTQGFWQGASTTVAYDSGQFGCGAVRVYSSVSQVITVMDAR